MSRNSDDDNKRFTLFCDPWNGSRTPGFRKFKRDFSTGASALFLHEDDSSIWQTCEDTDQGGGDPNADPLPAQGANGHINAVRRRRKRQAKTFQLIYQHIDDERLREMLTDLPHDDQRGVEAWRLIIRECDQGTSDLEILDIRLEFEQATIESTVGHSEDSIIMYSRVLNSLNARLPQGQKYSDDALAVKMLSNVAHPESLALDAVKELRAPAGSRVHERVVVVNGANVTVRHYQALVTAFDSTWRGLYKQGIIRPRAAGARHNAGALRVQETRDQETRDDARVVAEHEHEDDVYDDEHDADTAAYAYFRRGGRGGRGGCGGRGRAGKGGPFIPRTPFAGAQGHTRPRMCDTCWRAIMDAPHEARAALIAAINNRPPARARQVSDDPAVAAEEPKMLSDDAHQADDADDADSLSEDFAQHVWMCDDSPPTIGASSSSPLTQEVIEYMDGGKTDLSAG